MLNDKSKNWIKGLSNTRWNAKKGIWEVYYLDEDTDKRVWGELDVDCSTTIRALRTTDQFTCYLYGEPDSGTLDVRSTLLLEDGKYHVVEDDGVVRVETDSEDEWDSTPHANLQRGRITGAVSLLRQLGEAKPAPRFNTPIYRVSTDPDNYMANVSCVYVDEHGMLDGRIAPDNGEDRDGARYFWTAEDAAKGIPGYMEEYVFPVIREDAKEAEAIEDGRLKALARLEAIRAAHARSGDTAKKATGKTRTKKGSK